MGLLNRDLINKCGEHLGGDASISSDWGRSLNRHVCRVAERFVILSGALAEPASVCDICPLLFLIPWPFPLGSGSRWDPAFSPCPLISEGSSLSENLGSVSCGPQSTGGRLHEAQPAHARTDLTPATRILRQGWGARACCVTAPSVALCPSAAPGHRAQP